MYNNAHDLKYNAKILLDVFLEVPNDPAEGKHPRMTSGYCDKFLGRMEESMNCWNELTEQVRTDDGVIWEPETLTELQVFKPMWSACHSRREYVPPSLEFSTPVLVKRFLFQILSSKQPIPNFGSLEDEAEEWVRDVKKGTDENGNIREMPFFAEHVEFNACTAKVLEKFRIFSTYIHIREHAMIALIPLLQHLSEFDAKRLVYALFIEQTNNAQRRSCQCGQA